MSTFSSQLKICRAQAKITQKTMANYLEISERAYQHYELGTREPNFDILIKLADYFECSIDYLLGRTNDPTRH